MGGVTYEAAHAAIAKRLDSDALAHCERVADAAVLLAETYAVNVEKARVAGLLHDWDRQASRIELLSRASEGGIGVTTTDAAMPYLLHARTGALGAAEALPGLDPEIVSAIAKHTLGAEEMGDLDMLVYLADMLESGRAYSGVDVLRDAVGRVTLAELFAIGYRHSLAHLLEARRPIHPTTLAVWNRYVAVMPA
jgi:predicted HD superfamily hydrolase involved in NAD metabolism